MPDALLLWDALRVLAIPFVLLGGVYWLLGLWGRRTPLPRPVPDKLEGGSIRHQLLTQQEWLPSNLSAFPETPAPVQVTTFGHPLGHPTRYATLDEMAALCEPEEEGGV